MFGGVPFSKISLVKCKYNTNFIKINVYLVNFKLIYLFLHFEEIFSSLAQQTFKTYRELLNV